MNAPEPTPLPDVQAAADARRLAIQRVGVKGITHPVVLATAAGPQPSVATVEMMVALPADQKGTHMSRFLEVLDAHAGGAAAPLAAGSLPAMMDAMLARLEADTGWIELRLPFFVRKHAPVSGVGSLMDYRATLAVERCGGRQRLLQTVLAPVTALCPCSKEVSDYGAHNQRSHLTLQVELAPGAAALGLDEQVRIAEQAASSELWAVLKRGDEKFVTEHAYRNPRFVEDMVREIALRLADDARVCAWRIEAENFESIHNHSAYALIEHERGAA
jgi:GTP cyclohydrolase I